MTEKNRKPPNVLVVENSFDDMKQCKQLIMTVAPGTKVMESGNCKSALKILSTQHFDAVFISINLPESDGINLAKGLRTMAGYALVPIVFMGKPKEIHPEIALRVHAYEYLNKPLRGEEFRKKMSGLFKGLHEQQDFQNNPLIPTDRVFIVDMPGKKHLVHLKDLHFAEISGRQLTLYTKHGSLKGIRMKLNAFVKYIDDPRFVRCHKSFAVNIENIAGFKYVEPRIKAVQFIGETKQECLLSKTFFDSVLGRFANGKESGDDGTSGEGGESQNGI